MSKITVSEDLSGTRLDVFIQNTLNISRKQASGAAVYVNGVLKKTSYKLKLNDCVEFDDNLVQQDENLPEAQNIALDIKYEDEHLLVINKPKGMLTHPSAHQRENTLVNALLYRCGDNLSNAAEPFRRGIVHRLDKNTAGLMLAAKTDAAAASLQEQIKNKTAKRKYLAIALGDFEQSEGIIDKPLVHYMGASVKMNIANKGEGKDALTHYKVKESFNGAALVELELKTGRTHQIRAHLASINHPVFGDDLYGAAGFLRPEYKNIKTNQQVLQSYYLSFTHPLNNDIMEFELTPDEWDKDLIKVLKIMRSKK